MIFESPVDHVCDSPIDGICSWYHSCLCLYFIHFDDHMGMKLLRICFFFKNIHVIKWHISAIASVWTWMKQIVNIHGRPLMLMPFSHTQYLWSKVDASTACEQYRVAAAPRGPIPMKDTGLKTTRTPCGFSSPFKPITRQVTHCRY